MMGGQSERTHCQIKMTALNSFSYICIRALHSFRSFSHCHIQPNLCLHRTCRPLHLLGGHTIHLPAVTLSNRDTPTKLLKHFLLRTFTFLLSAHLIQSYPMPLLCTMSLVQLLLHHLHLGLYPQSLIAQHTFQCSPSSITLIHSAYYIPFTL